MRTTYEYQGRVQVLVMFLHKFLIIILGLLAVMSVEFSANIFRGWRRVIFLAERGFEGPLSGDKAKLTQPLAFRFVFHSRPHSNFLDPGCD